MMIQFVDAHSHANIPLDPEVLSIVTFRLAVERVPDSVQRFWIGVHPWDSDKIEGDIINAIRHYGDRVVGIGEIGLDYYYNSDHTDCQKSIFELQLDYAIRVEKPITIHCVRAYQDLISILKKRSGVLPKIIIHGFIGSVEVLKELLAFDCYISYGATALHSAKTLASLNRTPIDRLFLESDDNQHTPIKELYCQVASIINVDEQVLKEQLFRNYRTIINE